MCSGSENTNFVNKIKCENVAFVFFPLDETSEEEEYKGQTALKWLLLQSFGLIRSF
jgi:hypothetical protein